MSAAKSNNDVDGGRFCASAFNFSKCCSSSLAFCVDSCISFWNFARSASDRSFSTAERLSSRRLVFIRWILTKLASILTAGDELGGKLLPTKKIAKATRKKRTKNFLRKNTTRKWRKNGDQEMKKPPGKKVVRARGIEPPRGCPHMNLNHARLPIPPRARGGMKDNKRRAGNKKK